MLSGKARLLVAGVLLVILSLAYHFWLYPKLLQPVAISQSVQDIEWQAGAVVECQFVNSGQQCILRADKEGDNRFIGRLKGTKSVDAVVIYDWRMKLNPSAIYPESRYKVVLITEKNGWRLWQRPHHFFHLDFVNAWSGQGRLYFQQPVEGFQFLVDIKGTDASFVILDFKLVQGQETLWNRLAQATLILLWLGLFWIVLQGLWRTKNRWNLPLAIMLFITLLGTQLPNSSFTPIKDWLKEQHQTLMLAEAQKEVITQSSTVTKPQQVVSERNPVIVVKKVAHFVLFALVALFLWLRLQNSAGRLMWVLTLTLLFAVVTETLQALGKVRSASAPDVAIDMAGVVAILMIIAAWQQFKKPN